MASAGCPGTRKKRKMSKPKRKVKRKMSKKSTKGHRKKLPKGFPRNLPRYCAKFYVDDVSGPFIPFTPIPSAPPLHLVEQARKHERQEERRLSDAIKREEMAQKEELKRLERLQKKQDRRLAKQNAQIRNQANLLKQEREEKRLYGREEKITYAPVLVEPSAPLQTLLPTKSIRRGACERKYKEYTQGKHLGGGEFGEVFELCHDQKCPYVLKVQNLFDGIPTRSIADFTQEVDIHRLAYDKFKIAPRIHDAWICTPSRSEIQDPNIIAIGFIVMERMDGDLSNLPTDTLTMNQKNAIINVIRSHIDKLHQLGIEHRDIAYHNVFYTQENGNLRFVLGDFGLARPIGQKRPKDAWDGADDYERLKELDQYLSKAYRVRTVQGKVGERKRLAQPIVFQEFKGPQILPLPPLERYAEPSSLGYGETIVPTAFDRPISHAKLEQKYKEELKEDPLQPIPTFMECPSKMEHNKKLKPIPYPWRPYLQYMVRPKNIKDPLSDVWGTSAMSVQQLKTDEQQCFEKEARNLSYNPNDDIIKYMMRQVGDKSIMIYNDKPVEEVLKVINNDYLPFTSALNFVRVRARANILKDMKVEKYSPLNPIPKIVPFWTSKQLISDLRKFPVKGFMLPLLELIANFIAEESINIENWHLLSDIDAKIANRPAMDLVLFLYDVWFKPIKIDGIIVYSQSGLDMILERLKFLLQNRRETWAALQKQLK